VTTPEKTIGTTQDPDKVLRRLLKDLIRQWSKNSRKSRANLADELKARTGRKILSKRTINDWVGLSKRARFPAAYIEAFCEVISDDTVQRHVIGQRLRELLAIGESVTEAAGSLKRAQEAVARIVEQGRREAKTRKA
jgi:crotonobetainyl-CoA:carnitine CoA-transferase CaiB-like acyl-CoA transferase